MEQQEQTKQTIQDRGPVLPLGVPDSGGNYHRDLAIKPWRFKEERELGRLRDEHKDENLAKYIGMVLATMCTRIGPYDFTAMKLVEKRLVISQMFMGDVFYAYVWLRIHSLGADFPINFKPSWSNKEIKINADLNTVEVVSAESYEAACWMYELSNPIDIRSKQVSEFRMAPIRWSALESLEGLAGSIDLAYQKSKLILASVIGCEGIDGDVILTEQELEEMTKLDIEKLTAKLDAQNLGPLMVVDGKHKGRQFQARIDWGYDSFFAISST